MLIASPIVLPCVPSLQQVEQGAAGPQSESTIAGLQVDKAVQEMSFVSSTTSLVKVGAACNMK